jgi:hydroxylaminobenzene mutase
MFRKISPSQFNTQGFVMTFSTDSQRRLIWHGMFLFLLGLLIGFAEGQVINPRMGLAAHLEGLMNGTFLIALGAVWQFVRLSPALTTGTYWMVLYGTYANVIITTFSAVVGASSLSPITGVGHNAPPWQESLVTIGFVTVGIAMLVSSVLILWGLRRTAVDTIH